MRGVSKARPRFFTAIAKRDAAFSSSIKDPAPAVYVNLCLLSNVLKSFVSPFITKPTTLAEAPDVAPVISLSLTNDIQIAKEFSKVAEMSAVYPEIMGV